MLKHKEALSREHPWNDDLMARYTDQCEKFFGRFHRNPKRCFKTSRKLKYEMSNSSCWEYTRSMGGQKAYLLDHINGVLDSDYSPLPEDTISCPWDSWKVYRRCIVQCKFADNLLKMVEQGPARVTELRGTQTPSFETLMEVLGSTVTPAMVQAILEPLKVRLITKGPAAKYFLAKSYQKDLHKYISRLPQFELTKTPLCEDHIHRMMERERYIPNMTFTHFVSGDYSAATDNLGIQYCFTGLLESLMAAKVGPVFRNLLREVLGGHDIHYPPKFAIENFEQTNGQLMGSPLSFPFLCLANLIAYKLSLEDYTGLEYQFPHLPCLVNGDDILFRTNPEHYEIWKNYVRDIGFTLSVGKNYIHESVFTINSQMFTYHDRTLKCQEEQDRLRGLHPLVNDCFPRHRSISEVKYCNFGLLSGTSKLGGSRGEVREKALDLCDAYIKSVGGASDKALAMSRFMKRNKEDIQKITMRGRYNLFLPRELGGLGFPTYDGITFHVTRFQRLLAKLTLKSEDPKPLFGFRTSSEVNMVCGYESKNKKIMIRGIGPLPENLREIEVPEFIEANSAYILEATTKWFTRIPQKYNPAKLFPFRLKETDTYEYQKLRFVEVCYPQGLVSEERIYLEEPFMNFMI